MKTNGSVYVAVVLAVLAGYFTYQWWFNPYRAITRQLGELAATLSVPADSRDDVDRLARVAGLRNFFAPDVRVKMGPTGPELTSRDALIGAVAAWNPSATGWTVDFVDVQITLDSGSTARAYLTVTITTFDPGTAQPAVDAREAMVGLAEREGVWVITSAEPVETRQRP
jgi:SnoaL-like protein